MPILKKNGKIIKDWIESIPVDEVIDTTGCGDSFAGGLAYGFTYYNDPVIAARYANTLGALRTQGKTYDVFKNLERHRRYYSETLFLIQPKYLISFIKQSGDLIQFRRKNNFYPPVLCFSCF